MTDSKFKFVIILFIFNCNSIYDQTKYIESNKGMYSLELPVRRTAGDFTKVQSGSGST